MKKNLKLLLSVFLTFCSSPNGFVDLQDVITKPPIASGVVHTDNQGNVLGIIGKPADGYIKLNFDNNNQQTSLDDNISGLVPESIALGNPYPNPSNGPINIIYQLRKRGYVKIWVVRAKGKKDVLNHSLLAGAVIDKSFAFSEVLLLNKDRSAGSYIIQWAAQDNKGNLLPIGFYRIYFQIDDYLLWRDMLVLNNPADIINY